MNYANQHPSLATKAFNVLLWTLQILWGVFFSFTGFGKILAYDPAVGTTCSIRWPGFQRCRKACLSSSESVSFWEASA